MNALWYYSFDFGKIGISEDGKGLTEVFFLREPAAAPAGRTLLETPLLQRAAGQLQEYFDGKRRVFDLPLSFKGTPFQLDDWAALQTIPYGETRSYEEIARQIGRPKACRAVGMANHNNPVAIIVPCHRVIGKNGKLVGYGGGLDIKTRLLELEKRTLAASL